MFDENVKGNPREAPTFIFRLDLKLLGYCSLRNVGYKGGEIIP
jgi:hypothetical protein